MSFILLLDQKRMQWRNHEESVMNSEELANPNVDLRCGKAETYGRRSTVEGRRRSLEKLRLMQRPGSRKAKCAAAAAKLEQQ